MSDIQSQEKRLSELILYLEKFKVREKQSHGTDIFYIPDAAKIINSLYWRYADEIIRPSLTSNVINRYKIAASTELVIMLASPIKIEDKKKEKHLNARLAFYVAVEILIDWERQITQDERIEPEKLRKIFKTDEELNKQDGFIKEHINWLRLLEPHYYYPSFSNSQVWRLFYYLLRDRAKQL